MFILLRPGSLYAAISTSSAEKSGAVLYKCKSGANKKITTISPWSINLLDVLRSQNVGLFIK